MIKKSRNVILIICILTTFNPLDLVSEDAIRKNKLQLSASNEHVIKYSAEPFQPLKVLFDYYHHILPSTKVGNHIVTGSWYDNKGRYGWNDFVHTNTLDHAYIALADDYQIMMSREAYTKKLLTKTDIVVIVHADNPVDIPNIPVLTDEEIYQLRIFVENGGSLMVNINAGSTSRTHEGFEKKQLGKLIRGFGLDWNDDDTHYSDNKIPSGHPYFYDITNFHYGAGCTLKVLPNASKPEVLLEVYSDSTYTDRNVRGPGIIMVRPGKGKFMLIGDVGSWTGNMSRPWANNVKMLKQIFAYLKPNNGVVPPQFQKNKTLNYELQISGLQAIPVTNSLSEITFPQYKTYSPREKTNMPYFERTADLELECKDVKDQSAEIELKIKDFKWFDNIAEHNSEQKVNFTVSRQGKISKVKTVGYDAQWLAPDISSIIALLPVDGLQPGDVWNSVESLRIPILRGTDIAPVKQYDTKIKYVRDTEFDNKKCRLLESAGEIWLNDLGVTVEDLLPSEILRYVEGSPYRFFSPKGGKLLFKKEQWVDAETGIVLKAAYQTRIVAWIQDIRKPVKLKNADKDGDMIVSIAYVANFKLNNK